MKQLMYIGTFSIGSWGILGGIFPDYQKEIFMGMALPLLITLFSISKIKSIYNKNPEGVTSFMMKAFAGKMILYGIFFITIFSFYSFHQLSFVISFAGYFIALYVIEAVLLNSTFKNKY